MAKILIVEDDHLMRWSLEACLQRAGHSVHSVDSGSQALVVISEDEFQVVVTDYRIPQPDGFQLLQRIKAQIPRTHVILITGHPTPHMERYARDAGAFGFFDKPFELGALKQAVDRAVVTPERRKGPRGCCGGCQWRQPCGNWQMAYGGER